MMLINERDELEWTVRNEYKLPMPLYRCGYVLYKSFLVIFGGAPDGDFVDNVYLLDLDDNIGWIELEHIKCPIKGRYMAVIDEDNFLHLFSEVNHKIWRYSEKRHYSIPISTILGSKYSA